MGTILNRTGGLPNPILKPLPLTMTVTTTVTKNPPNQGSCRHKFFVGKLAIARTAVSRVIMHAQSPTNPALFVLALPEGANGTVVAAVAPIDNPRTKSSV